LRPFKRAKYTSKHKPKNSQSHPRIALFPLPPQKSGIANYSADLLPYLANYFDIDLFMNQNVRVSDPYLKNISRLSDVPNYWICGIL
jgi:hypothetical protein